MQISFTQIPPRRRQGGGVGFVFQKGLAQSSGFDAQFLKIILWPCTKLEGAAKLKITSSIINCKLMLWHT